MRNSLILLYCVLALATVSGRAEPDRLMTEAEIKALEGENTLWRMVRTSEEVPANLARWAAAGATPEQMAALRPKLEELWQVTYERNFGWLREDTVERVKDIDREFTARMRAARLFAATGARPNGESPGSERAVERLWRGAILRALGYDEIAEFRLMNSALARDEMRRIEGLSLTEDELRTLFVWRREYEERHIPAVPDAGLSAVQQGERSDEWRRKRQLLGDARFALYLEREHAGFEVMRQALGLVGVADVAVALDLWLLRQGDGFARNQEPRVAVRDEMTAAIRTKATTLIGRERLAEYSKDPDARWIVIPVRPNSRRAGIGRAPGTP